jgi:MoxR-like ATPase
MQERQVTIGGTTFPLPEPFLVLATQNPIEQEGTYPLPEAQIDRFMLKLVIDYPNKGEELQILRRMSTATAPVAKAVCDPDAILRARQATHELYIDEKVELYIVDLVCATRQPQDYGLKDLSPLIEYGASPRATIYLSLAAKAHAFLQGRGYVTPDDVLSIGMDVLRHRVIVSYEAEAEEIDSEEIITRIFKAVEIP